MQVILLKDVKNLGQKGDIKSVKSGHARNHLIPQGLAKLATRSDVDTLAAEKIESVKHVRELEKIIKGVEKDTSELPLLFSLKTGEKGEIFGSIRADEVKSAIVKRYPAIAPDSSRARASDTSPEDRGAATTIGAGIKVLKDHIKELGKQTVNIDLGNNIKGRVTIEIKPDGD